MERLLVVMGPKMTKVWYFGGPKGQNLKKARFFKVFKGSRGGSPRHGAQTGKWPGVLVKWTLGTKSEHIVWEVCKCDKSWNDSSP